MSSAYTIISVVQAHQRISLSTLITSLFLGKFAANLSRFIIISINTIIMISLETRFWVLHLLVPIIHTAITMIEFLLPSILAGHS